MDQKAVEAELKNVYSSLPIFKKVAVLLPSATDFPPPLPPAAYEPALHLAGPDAAPRGGGWFRPTPTATALLRGRSDRVKKGKRRKQRRLSNLR